ncbi:MAG: SNF2-related protein [Desulfovibrionaceae bacterium]
MSIDTMLISKASQVVDIFIRDSVPEYFKEILHTLTIQKISISETQHTILVQATVTDDDLQKYNIKEIINTREERLQHTCNCFEQGFSICIHVAAILLQVQSHFKKQLSGEIIDEKKTLEKPQRSWKELFFSTSRHDFEIEKGTFYVTPHLYPEHGGLSVGFFRTRQNKQGLSSIQTPITIRQILENSSWYSYTSQMPSVINQLCKLQEYDGHRVGIPEELISCFLWFLAHEPYVFFKDTDTLCHIEKHPSQLKIHAHLQNNTYVQLSIILKREFQENHILESDNSIFLGKFPLWLVIGSSFYPIVTTVPHHIFQNIVTENPQIPQAEVTEFLEKVWVHFPKNTLDNDVPFLDSIKELFQEATYTPKLYLAEEGTLLTLTIENVYSTQHGSFTLQGPNPYMETDNYSYNGKIYFIHREQDQEGKLISTLESMFFQEKTPSQWFLESEKVVNFLLESFTPLVKEYTVFGEKNLEKYKIRSSPPILSATIEDTANKESFVLNLSVNYGEYNVEIEKIWEQWLSGKRYVQLKDGSYAGLPEEWLQQTSHALEVSGIEINTPPKKNFPKQEALLLENIVKNIPNVQSNDSWKNLQKKLHDFKNTEIVEQPKGLQTELRSYQITGLSYFNFLSIYNFGGILADEMGLGKTVQTLSFIQHQVEQGNTKPNLVIMPTSVLYNWEREAEKFIPYLKTLTIHGTNRIPFFEQIPEVNLVFTTYVLLRKDIKWLCKYSFNCIILDEAQNIKNPNTITARSVRELHSRIRLCLSGTPIENNLFELWSLFEFLMPGFLGAQSTFQKNIIKPIQEGNEEILAYFKAKIHPFILRRTKKEVLKELPQKVITTSFCPLVEEQQELYTSLAKRLKNQILLDVKEKGIAKSQISILDALLKLRQICCHPRLLRLNIPGINTNILSGKFEAFKEMIFDIIEEKHRVLVFSQFTQMLHIIREWLTLEDIPYCYLDGTVKNRSRQVDIFNNTPSIPVFLISLKAGGTGLNLTSADYVIHYDPWWNPAVENQATDRIHRIGQSKQVFSYKLICQNTVEEKILLLQEKKKHIADSIISSGMHVKTITKEDIAMLFETE